VNQVRRGSSAGAIVGLPRSATAAMMVCRTCVELISDWSIQQRLDVRAASSGRNDRAANIAGTTHLFGLVVGVDSCRSNQQRINQEPTMSNHEKPSAAKIKATLSTGGQDLTEEQASDALPARRGKPRSAAMSRQPTANRCPPKHGRPKSPVFLAPQPPRRAGHPFHPDSPNRRSAKVRLWRTVNARRSSRRRT